VCNLLSAVSLSALFFWNQLRALSERCLYHHSGGLFWCIQLPAVILYIAFVLNEVQYSAYTDLCEKESLLILVVSLS
jgi:hypothetical protein